MRSKVYRYMVPPPNNDAHCGCSHTNHNEVEGNFGEQDDAGWVFYLELPKSAQFMIAEMKDGVPNMWFQVPEASLDLAPVKRKFRVTMTGPSFDSDGAVYLGTFQKSAGLAVGPVVMVAAGMTVVAHLFEFPAYASRNRPDVDKSVRKDV